jgi:ATP-dependent DNA helicase RecQ
MKTGHDIMINRDRAKAQQGGSLALLDPVAHGRVQLLRTAPAPAAQAIAAVDELIRLSQLVPDWSWSKAAIIAREWRLLEPVRSYCEARGVPVHLASEGMPPFWRLREVREFLKFLKAEPTKMIAAEAMQDFVTRQPSNDWWALIAEGIAALDSEIDGKAVPVIDIIELLAEWIRDNRQEQYGLMLLTAHRAKGLEFDDLVILDGGWDRKSKEEDRDAPRRLFYVAMTRAKRSLAIVSMQDRHPILQEVVATLVERRITSDEATQSECGLQYQTVEPHMVDLSWVGRQAANHPAHQALARIRTGDPVQLIEINGRWEIRVGGGVTVGRMAQGYRPPEGSFIRGEVGAIICWRKVDNAEEFRGTLRREAWEVVLPELVFRH